MNDGNLEYHPTLSMFVSFWNQIAGTVKLDLRQADKKHKCLKKTSAAAQTGNKSKGIGMPGKLGNWVLPRKEVGDPGWSYDHLTMEIRTTRCWCMVELGSVSLAL